jgi:catechol 2,3-dioxygenase-like lactoylglutathione lyase family enzyme
VTFSLTAIDHVQLAMPVGREADAEAFYAGVLGLAVIPKPEPLAARGGCWFASGGVAVHLGVEEGFTPARKAHPAFRVQHLDELVRRLGEVKARWRWDDALPGVRRLYVEDPFGNRIELIDGGS